jgi:8-oxo-dGTP diphosphatase
VIATDVAIFSVQNSALHVLLIQMKKSPFSGMWALPGGLIHSNETPDAAAKRHLAEKAGLTNTYLEQLYTFGRVDRDPFGRVVSVAYMSLIPSSKFNLKTTQEYAGVQWFPIFALPKLAYDHSEIISKALERLRSKLEYTNIVYGLLPREFTLSDLQRAYETILMAEIDKRNFRRKILGLGLVTPLRKKTAGSANRPARLFKFATRKPTFVNIL